jgi:hypothetical protein
VSGPSSQHPVARRRWRRVALHGAVGALSGTLAGGVAYADAAQPTDYRSEVVAITPDTPGVSARIVGGDAFIELTVAPGIDVMVLGYENEPYLHVDPDGTVSENVRSPAHFLDESRFASVTLPPEADADAPPEWQVVGRGGSWAWHDHRTHWMADTPPLGVEVGDQILDDVVPLVVDGRPVEVSVVSVWEAAPSLWPSLVVALVAGALAGGLVRVVVPRRAAGAARPAIVRATWTASVSLAAAALAAAVGLWQTWSLPSETGPPLSHWLLPVTAGVAAVLGLVWRANGFMSLAAAAVASTQLVVWGVVRRSVLDHAVLPTSAPFWLDRWGTAAVAAVSLVVLAHIVITVVRSPQSIVTGGRSTQPG